MDLTKFKSEKYFVVPALVFSILFATYLIFNYILGVEFFPKPNEEITQPVPVVISDDQKVIEDKLLELKNIVDEVTIAIQKGELTDIQQHQTTMITARMHTELSALAERYNIMLQYIGEQSSPKKITIPSIQTIREYSFKSLKENMYN